MACANPTRSSGTILLLYVFFLLLPSSVVAQRAPGTGAVGTATHDANTDPSDSATRHFIADFGGIGDDSTSNAAAFARAVSYMNANGGYTVLPRGIYRTTAIPTLACNACGFIGSGSGMAHNFPTGPSSQTFGTIIRLTSTAGDTITIAPGATGVMIRDVGFWPVAFKKDGAEIVNRGTGSLFANLMCVYSHRCLDFSGGSNGATAIHIRSFGMWGPEHIRIKGTSSAIGGWAQAVIIDDFQAYNSWPVAEPAVGTTTAAWAARTIYGVGSVTVANGYVWQAVTEGRSSTFGAGPRLPAYSYAGEPTTLAVEDGTVRWHMIQAEAAAGVNADSNAVDVHVSRSYLDTTYYGIRIQNTLASSVPPQYVQVTNTLMDHNVGDGAFVSAGYQVTFRDCKFHLSALGRGFTGGQGFTSGLQIFGGHVWANALDGILLPQLADADAIVQGVNITGNGTRNANTYDGIVAPDHTGRYVLLGNIIGSDAGGTMRYAISLGKGNDNFVVSNNVGMGNRSGTVSNGSGGGITRIVEKNL